jgi:hypothetical protein
MKTEQLENLEGITIDEEAVADLAKQSFVDTWEETKKNLETARDASKNIFLKTSISLLIAFGNGLHKRWGAATQ